METETQPDTRPEWMRGRFPPDVTEQQATQALYEWLKAKGCLGPLVGKTYTVEEARERLGLA